MMHIPSVATTQLQLVTFREALAAANTPSAEYDIEKRVTSNEKASFRRGAHSSRIRCLLRLAE